MRDNDKLANDVDLLEIAKKTKNFSGAEIEGLIRASTATAMNRLIKVCIHCELIFGLYSLIVFVIAVVCQLRKDANQNNHREILVL